METRNTLRALAGVEGVRMQEIVDEDAKRMRRQEFFSELDKAYAALETEPQAWQGWQDELSDLDSTLNDGLEGL